MSGSRPDASTELVRAFVAVDVGEAVRTRIAECCAAMRKRARADVRWVDPRNMHLTLLFLGSVPSGMIETLRAPLHDAATFAAPLCLEVAGLGFFGSPRSPRVLWAGIRGDVDGLCALQRDVAEGVRQVGIAFDDKPFKPHLTLGRFRSNRDAGSMLDAIAAAGGQAFGAVRIDRMALMKSTLLPQGAEYAVLAEFPLAAPELQGARHVAGASSS